jgi:hypothetical protein
MAAILSSYITMGHAQKVRGAWHKCPQWNLPWLTTLHDQGHWPWPCWSACTHFLMLPHFHKCSHCSPLMQALTGTSWTKCSQRITQVSVSFGKCFVNVICEGKWQVSHTFLESRQPQVEWGDSPANKSLVERGREGRNTPRVISTWTLRRVSQGSSCMP